jgi:high-affinity K+ transport system ATPase subunit B
MFFKNFAAACQKDKNKSTANHCKKARQETTTKKLKKIIKKKKKKKKKHLLCDRHCQRASDSKISNIDPSRLRKKHT